MSIFVKRFLLLTAIFTTCGFFVFALTSVAKYKPFGVPDLRRAEWDALQAKIKEDQRLRDLRLAAEASGQGAVPHPSVSADYYEYDFGMLNPGESAVHSFVIRNVGNAPLILKAGDTSCKCTLSEVAKQIVDPGDSTEISLTWNTGQEREFYRQYAVIETNDPENREVELAVTGTIRTLLEFEEKEIFVPAIKPGEGVDLTAVILSQTLSEFSVESATCDLPGFAYSIEPLVDEELVSKNATSGWKLRVTSSAELGDGDFSFPLSAVLYSPELAAEESPVSREVRITGRVASRISFYGAMVDSRSGLDLGVVADGKGKVVKTLIKVRSTSLPASLIVTQLQPELLEAKIERMESRQDTFVLTIQIPANAPYTVFNAPQNRGYIEVADPRDSSFSAGLPIYGTVLKID